MTIKNEFPELSKYLEEMPETIPNHSKPEITLLNLCANFIFKLQYPAYSTVTDFAKFLGWSTLQLRITAI